MNLCWNAHASLCWKHSTTVVCTPALCASHFSCTLQLAWGVPTSASFHCRTSVPAAHVHFTCLDMWGLCLLQRLPVFFCGAAQVSTAYILCALSAPGGIKINTLTPQGSVVVIFACGIAICIYTCLFVPCIIRRCGFGIHHQTQIRRINLLGLVGCPATVLAVHDYMRNTLAINASLPTRAGTPAA